ncbi:MULTISPECIES: hypothetical protein [Pseudanabaena]|uniref:hypothetical protein n=1 Tax=Pseudanabaena TaxID=1152 RepID=UPI00247A2472|nr:MULTISPECIES: hypothetical protein [Pseudanabaena]MEA5489284.1 hypothetical protein [Pseudanabaena sp. CCNP1317]WGS74082.1 hypothetical protein OA858_08655 [Pseudanabaena galeata CCNP1313]
MTSSELITTCNPHVKEWDWLTPDEASGLIPNPFNSVYFYTLRGNCLKADAIDSEFIYAGSLRRSLADVAIFRG